MPAMAPELSSAAQIIKLAGGWACVGGRATWVPSVQLVFAAANKLGLLGWTSKQAAYVENQCWHLASTRKDGKHGTAAHKYDIP